ncbi:MAG: hypothetical protein RLZZ546_1240 [Bacteroidota bacterium]|jgi:hypothetical protein
MKRLFIFITALLIPILHQAQISFGFGVGASHYFTRVTSVSNLPGWGAVC